MRCKGCDYPLWNLPGRICPECGRPFLPSEFEFVVNSVQFCCPGCGQDYYGTGLHGHLTPAEFTCIRCARPVRMDEMVLLPTEGVKEEQTRADRMPWLERKRIGFIRAWFGTVFWAMFDPGRLAKATPRESSAWQGWWFGTLSNTLYLCVALLPLLVMMGGTGVTLVRVFLFTIPVAVVMVAVIVTAVIPLWGASAHAVLRLTGRTDAGVGASIRTVGYASSASVISVVPCFGCYLALLAWLWSCISATLMLCRVQKVNGFRATVAAFALPVTLVAVVAAAWVYIFSSTMTRVRTMARQAAATAASRVQNQADSAAVGRALLDYREREGAWPAHAMQTVQKRDLLVQALSAPGGGASRVGPVTLDQFNLLSTDEERRVVELLARSLPSGVIAHRAGDYVFTYHGVDPDTMDTKLWIAVSWPDPERPGATDPMADGNAPIWAVNAFGGATPVLPGAFDAMLSQQNTLRAAYGLAPLPGPADVTAAAPASGVP